MKTRMKMEPSELLTATCTETEAHSGNLDPRQLEWSFHHVQGDGAVPQAESRSIAQRFLLLQFSGSS
jgi:hypothetical protein